MSEELGFVEGACRHGNSRWYVIERDENGKLVWKEYKRCEGESCDCFEEQIVGRSLMDCRVS